jgi:hypothetical protein
MDHNSDGAPVELNWILRDEAAMTFGEQHDKFQEVLEKLYDSDQINKADQFAYHIACVVL